MKPAMLFFFSMFFTAFSGAAQELSDPIVNIPDRTLKNEILKIYDQNKDGEISVKEAEKVTIIEFYTEENGCNVGSLKGIEAMPNLIVLSCENFPNSKHFIKEVNLSNNKKLKHLDLSGNKLTAIDLSFNPELETVRLIDNQLTAIDLEKNSNIRLLHIGYNPKIRNLKINHLNKLSSFDCSMIKMEELDVSAFPNMEDIKCCECNLKRLTIGVKKRLVLLDCSMNQLKELDLSQVTVLFDPTYDQPDFNFTSNPELKTIKVWPQFREQQNEMFLTADESAEFILQNDLPAGK